MTKCSDDLFWIFVWVAIAFFSRSAIDLLYEFMNRYIDIKNTLADNIVICSISFLILFYLVRVQCVDMTRKQKEQKDE